MDIALKLIRNAILLTVGTVSLAIGIVGILLPILPGTPFLILSAVCFTLLFFF
jgi:uncharacterized membrane protein YbaN (DUF454 family)